MDELIVLDVEGGGVERDYSWGNRLYDVGIEARSSCSQTDYTMQILFMGIKVDRLYGTVVIVTPEVFEAIIRTDNAKIENKTSGYNEVMRISKKTGLGSPLMPAETKIGVGGLGVKYSKETETESFDRTIRYFNAVQVRSSELKYRYIRSVESIRTWTKNAEELELVESVSFDFSVENLEDSQDEPIELCCKSIRNVVVNPKTGTTLSGPRLFLAMALNGDAIPLKNQGRLRAVCHKRRESKA